MSDSLTTVTRVARLVTPLRRGRGAGSEGLNRTLPYCLLLALMLLQSTAQALEITQVQLDNNYIEPKQGDSATVSFTLSEPAVVSLKLYDGRDLLIRDISSTGLLAAGTHEFTWDGSDQTGELVPPEAYRYLLLAEPEKGEPVIFDLTAETAGQDVVADEILWQPETRSIRYRLSEPARVNIRTGLKNFGPLLDTVIDWVPRTGGFHEESWQGRDASGVLDLSHHPMLDIAVDAFALGRNTIIVGPASDRITLIEDMDWAVEQRPLQIEQIKRMHMHSQQPITTRGDVTIHLVLPDDLPVTEEGVPILRGQIPVRMEVSDADRQRIIERRFEPVFFVDGTFTFENEVGFLPFTWIWDTTKANDGEHFITGNLRGYEGNFGMATVKVIVDNQSEGVSP